MPPAELTVDELLQALKHSSLPTVLCEGATDLEVLRHLEDILDPRRVSFLPCGGKATLLALFDRRREIGETKVAFLADRDAWIFTGVPRRYKDVILTWGYSIENDLIAGSEILRLLSGDERRKFQTAAKETTRWFAFEIAKLPGNAAVDVHISRILEPNGEALSTQFLQEINFQEPPIQLVDSICSNFTKFLRGKTLAQLLIRYLRADLKRC